MFSNPKLQEGPLQGGGFVNSGVGNAAPSYMTETLRPVTIKQLLTWDTDSAGKTFIDNIEVTKIKIVGQVKLATDSAPCRTFIINDGSDEVTVKLYGYAEVKQGDLVAIYGRPDSFGGGKEVFAFGVKRIYDPWEVRYHYFAAVAEHVARTKSFNRNKLGMIDLPGVPRRAELIAETSSAAQEARKRKLAPFTPSPYKDQNPNQCANSEFKRGSPSSPSPAGSVKMQQKRKIFPSSDASPHKLPRKDRIPIFELPKIPGMDEEEVRSLSKTSREVITIVYSMGGVSGTGHGVKPELICVQLPLLGLQSVRTALIELESDGLIEETDDGSFVLVNMTG